MLCEAAPHLPSDIPAASHHVAGGIVHSMGPADTAALVKEVGAEAIGQLVVAMGSEVAASVVHAMGVDLTADLVGQLGVGVAAGIVRSAGGAETGSLVRAMGADFVAQLVTKMGVTQNVALVAALGPTVLASLVASMGTTFIAMLSLSMSAEIFHAIFGALGWESGQGGASADQPVSPADTYRASTTASSSSSFPAVSGIRSTPVTLQPTQRVLIPTVTVSDSSTGGSKLLPHLADGTRIPVAASPSSSSSSAIAGSRTGAGAGGIPGELESHPITPASTATTALSIDSAVGIPAAPGIPTESRVLGSKAVVTDDVKFTSAVPLTNNAQQVSRDVEQQIRDQGGNFK